MISFYIEVSKRRQMTTLSLFCWHINDVSANVWENPVACPVKFNRSRNID